MIFLLISVICFWILWRFAKSIEIREHGEWKSFKASLWLWILVAFACLVPIINIIGIACIVLITIVDTRSFYPEIRFKEGKSHWLIKLIDFMNKEF